MSSYDCVLPVNWARLWKVVIPAWYEALTGRKTIESFCGELIPKGDRAFRLSEHRIAPSGYLDDIGWDPAKEELRAEALMNSKSHKEYFSLSGDFLGNHILFDAIKQTAGEELPGEDIFAERPRNGFYSRLHGEPFVQVAGTKSRFHWMNGLFGETGHHRNYHEAKAYFSFRPNKMVEATLANLLSQLLLTERTLPGVELFGPPSSWPASDDPSLQGYLSPGEVDELAGRLERLEALTREQD